MKKKIYFVGTLLMVAMSAMFVSCSKNTPSNGCKCTMEIYGEKETFAVTTPEMINEYGVQSCGALTNLVKDDLAADGMASAKVSCTGY